MKEKLLTFIKGKKGGQLLFIIGIVGIVLIYLSSVMPKKTETQENASVQEEFSEKEYAEYLEQQVREIVAAISGDISSVVTVSLESGITYIYAEEKKDNLKSQESESSEQTERKYITVKDSEGNEKPLLITKQMPAVRGVAIVCNPVGEETGNKIKNAVMAALDITSRKIYIAAKGRTTE